MFAIGTQFPDLTLPSSKGGTVRLGEVYARGPLVLAVVPRNKRSMWLDEISRRITKWLLQEFVNVYLIIDVSQGEARDICDDFGIQAAILSDDQLAVYPAGEGFYRLNEAGGIEAAVAADEELSALDRLFAK